MECLNVAKIPLFFFTLSEQDKKFEAIFHSQSARMAPSL